MQVEVVPLTDFVHGRISANEGRPIMLENSLARDLERAGLVRIKLTTQSNKEVVGKVADDGAGRPLSALQAAHLSPTQTLHLPKHGDDKRRKTGI